MGYATYTQTKQEAVVLTVSQDGFLPYQNMIWPSSLCHGLFDINYNLF